MTKFPERLKGLRIENGYKQKKVALDFGVSQCAISRWENGMREPSLEKLVEIARYFKVTCAYLIGQTDMKK